MVVTHGITFSPHIVRRAGERHILAAYPNRSLDKECCTAEAVPRLHFATERREIIQTSECLSTPTWTDEDPLQALEGDNAPSTPKKGRGSPCKEKIHKLSGAISNRHHGRHDGFGPTSPTCPACLFQAGPGGSHVVDQDHVSRDSRSPCRPPPNPHPAPTPHSRRTSRTHLRSPPRPTKTAAHLPTGDRGNSPCNRHRMVVAPMPATQRRRRHRNQHRRTGIIHLNGKQFNTKRLTKDFKRGCPSGILRLRNQSPEPRLVLAERDGSSGNAPLVPATCARCISGVLPCRADSTHPTGRGGIPAGRPLHAHQLKHQALKFQPGRPPDSQQCVQRFREPSNGRISRWCAQVHRTSFEPGPRSKRTGSKPGSRASCGTSAQPVHS